MPFKLRKAWSALTDKIAEKLLDPYEKATIQKHDSDNYLITLTNGEQYIGNTKWYSYPEGKRANPFISSELYNVHKRELWRQANAPLINITELPKDHHIEQFDKHDYVVTLKNGKQYVGFGIIWLTYPAGKDADMITKSKLYGIWDRHHNSSLIKPNEVLAPNKLTL